jgi:hypothetical protein
MGAIAIVEDQAGNGIQSADRPSRELGKGVMIALPRSTSEVSLHPASRPIERPCGRFEE